jgi:hypothetical protein
VNQIRFVWHDGKASENLRKHGVTFDEAKTVFSDDHRVEIYDAVHSVDEDRVIVIGISERLRLLMVVTTEQHEAIRIISARRANRTEEARYAGEVHG